MRKLINYLIMTVFMMCSCCAQNSRLDCVGVLNDIKNDIDFSKGGDAIKESIKMNLYNLNFYEYSHVLPELYYLIENDFITSNQWITFTDSLKNLVITHMDDTILPYWANEYYGLIPLQVQFFISSININTNLNQKFPKAYKMLITNTPKMDGLGYEFKDFDSLITIKEVVGETNFWFFFQLYDCKLIQYLQEKNPDKYRLFENIIQNYEITSTYKTPFYLQKRKWQSIQRRLLKSDLDYCIDSGNAMSHISIRIEDDNKDYYMNSMKDNINKDILKEF